MWWVCALVVELEASLNPDDFEEQMALAVREEAPLWEVPLGSRDLLPDNVIVHGPFDPTACAAVLGAWCERGWLTLYEWRAGEAARAPKSSDIIDVLRSPERWLPDSREGLLRLCRTDAGCEVPWTEWIESAR